MPEINHQNVKSDLCNAEISAADLIRRQITIERQNYAFWIDNVRQIFENAIFLFIYTLIRKSA